MFEDDKEYLDSLSLLDRVKRFYWKLIPYDWRPGQILYRLRCFFWYRYTVIHPITLPHYTWTDRCTLLPHFMFQILVDFVDKECSLVWVDWYGKYPHLIMVDGVEKNVRDEMQDLYDWWKKAMSDNDEYSDIWDHDLRQEYENNFDLVHKISKSNFRKTDNGYYQLFHDFESESDEKKWETLIRRNMDIQRLDQELLIQKMQRLCALQPYLWT